jgi:hypothetical protein
MNERSCCEIDWMLDELTPAVKARMRAEYQHDARTRRSEHCRQAALALWQRRRDEQAQKRGAA